MKATKRQTKEIHKAHGFEVKDKPKPERTQEAHFVPWSSSGFMWGNRARGHRDPRTNIFTHFKVKQKSENLLTRRAQESRYPHYEDNTLFKISVTLWRNSAVSNMQMSSLWLLSYCSSECSPLCVCLGYFCILHCHADGLSSCIRFNLLPKKIHQTSPISTHTRDST